MPYVDVQTIHNPSTGGIAPASWGDGVRDALQYLSGGFAHASILESTPQSVANGTETDLTSNEENSDVGGMHSTSSNTERLTVPAGEGGLYRFTATVSFAADVDGYRVVVFRVNNTTNYNVAQIAAVAIGGIGTIITGSRTLVLVAGDYVTCRVFHSAGAALNVSMLDFSGEWRATA